MTERGERESCDFELVKGNAVANTAITGSAIRMIALESVLRHNPQREVSRSATPSRVDVISTPPERQDVKLHLGCGPNLLKGWHNHDRDVDLTEPLPWQDDSCAFVFCEHVLEHLDCPRALVLMDEVYRVLRPGGVFRLAVPCMERFFERAQPEHLVALARRGYCEPTRISATRRIILSHEHRSWYTQELLLLLLGLAGFASAETVALNESRHPQLRNIDGQWIHAGRAVNVAETCTVDATK